MWCVACVIADLGFSVCEGCGIFGFRAIFKALVGQIIHGRLTIIKQRQRLLDLESIDDLVGGRVLGELLSWACSDGSAVHYWISG